MDDVDEFGLTEELTEEELAELMRDLPKILEELTELSNDKKKQFSSDLFSAKAIRIQHCKDKRRRII